MSGVVSAPAPYGRWTERVSCWCLSYQRTDSIDNVARDGIDVRFKCSSADRQGRAVIVMTRTPDDARLPRRTPFSFLRLRAESRRDISAGGSDRPPGFPRRGITGISLPPVGVRGEYRIDTDVWQSRPRFSQLDRSAFGSVFHGGVEARPVVRWSACWFGGCASACGAIARARVDEES